MAVTGPDFVSLQVRDLERSAAFYEQYLGLKRSDAGPPHAVVFDTKPIAFAVRDVVAGVDLDAIAQARMRCISSRTAKRASGRRTKNAACESCSITRAISASHSFCPIAGPQ